MNDEHEYNSPSQELREYVLQLYEDCDVPYKFFATNNYWLTSQHRYRLHYHKLLVRRLHWLRNTTQSSTLFLRNIENKLVLPSGKSEARMLIRYSQCLIRELTGHFQDWIFSCRFPHTTWERTFLSRFFCTKWRICSSLTDPPLLGIVSNIIDHWRGDRKKMFGEIDLLTESSLKRE